MPRERLRDHFQVTISLGFDEPDPSNVITSDVSQMIQEPLKRDEGFELRYAPLLEITRNPEGLTVLWENKWPTDCTQGLVLFKEYENSVPAMAEVFQIMRDVDGSCRPGDWRQEEFQVAPPTSTVPHDIAIGRGREDSSFRFIPIR